MAKKTVARESAAMTVRIAKFEASDFLKSEIACKLIDALGVKLTVKAA